ncbi:hypothetical protein BaRGS_00018206 [Batillaria attramentaria]|uniref:Purple acid phosphatase n=1 Tax=Batillaria attramentaria TaxID=370345 RepID=A0ABD0KU92_9CAEN
MENETFMAFSVRHIIIGFILCMMIKSVMNAVESKQRSKFLGIVHPEQIHISFGDTSQDIVIMWATKRDEVFHVQLVDSEANETVKIFEGERAVLDKLSSRAAKHLHRVHLKQLKPGEMYGYRVVGKTGANSNMYAFTVPYDSKKKKVHTFMILADMGLASKSMKFLTYEAAKGLYEAVFHVGDIAYNLDLDEGSIGDKYMNNMEKFAARIPYMTVPGDHEKYHDFAHYRYRFSMPNTPWPMPAEKLWYSLDVGPVHFVTINTEVFYSQTDQKEEQIVWLQNDLLELRKRRDQHPWLIVLGHKPMYSSRSDFPGGEEEDCSSEKDCIIRQELEDIFYQEGVDLYISGHRHNYERTWPMYRGKVFQEHYENPPAPVYIVNGAMGYQLIVENIIEHNPWTAFSTSDPEKELYGKLEILNGSHLMWDVFDASNNEKVDSILVIRKFHLSFGKAGDSAFEEMKKFRALPPAPLGWHAPEQKPVEENLVYKFRRLQPSTRKFYLWSACFSLLAALFCLISSPRVRRQLCRRK